MVFSGLSSAEAAQRLQRHGPNLLKDAHKVSVWKILFRQVSGNAIIYLLLCAAGLSFIVGKHLTAYTILAVITMVIGAGFLQEFKAERAMASLKKLVATVCKTFRDGIVVVVPVEQLVPGDIIRLTAGEKVPADAVILKQTQVSLNESVLTGESMPVKKQAGDPLFPTEAATVYMGTYVVAGKCTAQIIATGMQTKFGDIAKLISETEKKVPLQDKVNRVALYMMFVAMTVSLLTGIALAFQAPTLTQEVLTNIFILMIALAVSAFPEGFPVVLITTLASGASKMAKRNAIVNRMSIIETLGETTVVCADKTGTMTKGEMTVKAITLLNNQYEVTGVGYDPIGAIVDQGAGDTALTTLLHAIVTCNDAHMATSTMPPIGSPTEIALMVAAAKSSFGLPKSEERVHELPFSSERKMMSVLIKTPVYLASEQPYTVYAKGAAELLLAKCTYVQQGNIVVPLTDVIRTKLTHAIFTQANRAYRTLAVAYKAVHDQEYTEDEFIFLGFVSLEDPPREEVAAAIAQAQKAKIVVKMITGDNKATAVAIGQQVGIEGDVLTGAEVDVLTDQALAQRVQQIAIFARVRPEHKLRIVRALQSHGEIVTMTGDGVNDAPALKEAQIGIAMGKNGTDVARSVADITLKDDNFATIIAAIAEGRAIYNNIRKFVSYQLSCNLAELVILFVGVLLAPLLGWQTPLLVAMQILFMNLITDNLPAITLGLNPASKDIITHPPRRRTSLLDRRIVLLILFTAVVMACFTLASYYLSFNILGYSAEQSRTLALVCLILLELAGAFSFRSYRHLVLNRSLFINKYLFIASLLSLIATLVIVYSPLATPFETRALSLPQWIIPLAFALTMIVLYDGLKLIKLLPALANNHGE